MSEINEMNEMEELDLITMVSEDGEEIVLEIIDYFFYNGEEYAILTDYTEEETDELEDEGLYILKVTTATDEDGEEVEEFSPIEDEKLEKKLFEIATTRMTEDEEPED